MISLFLVDLISRGEKFVHNFGSLKDFNAIEFEFTLQNKISANELFKHFSCLAHDLACVSVTVGFESVLFTLPA